MTPSEYMQEVLRTVSTSTTQEQRLIIAALGLAGETGEVIDHIKKQTKEAKRDLALTYFLSKMEKGHIEYRDGELWRMWELRRGWLKTPRRAEKLTSNGYYILRTHDNSIGFPLYIMAHRVIWAYFQGDIDPSLVINHKNGIKHDNRLTNLEIVTPSQNTLHAVKTGLLVPARGLDSGRGKLSDDDVQQIRLMLNSGQYRQWEIANRFGVRPNQISRIKTGTRRSIQQQGA